MGISRRRLAIATTACACAGLAVAFVVLSPPSGRVALAQHGQRAHRRQQRPSARARRQELTNVMTAPLEHVARELGNVLASAVEHETTLSSEVPAWGDAVEPAAVPSSSAVKRLIESDFYLKYMRGCCHTLYFAPSVQKALSGLMDMPLSPVLAPAEKGKPYGVRFRYFVGDGNDMVFNGGTAETVKFINRYFGWNIKTVPASKNFLRKARANEYGLALSHDLYQETLGQMPESLAASGDVTAVDVASLPMGESTVIFDDVPPGNHWDPAEHDIASPAFRLKYCQAADHRGELNHGLPLKVRPGDCGTIYKKFAMQCKCGNVFFFGWAWAKAGENIYEKSVINLQSLVSQDDLRSARLAPAPALSEARSLKARAPQPRQSKAISGHVPHRVQTKKDHTMRACKEAPDYDPAAQNWYYETQEGTRMVRHWCPSVWIPQVSACSGCLRLRVP